MNTYDITMKYSIQFHVYCPDRILPYNKRKKAIKESNRSNIISTRSIRWNLEYIRTIKESHDHVLLEYHITFQDTVTAKNETDAVNKLQKTIEFASILTVGPVTHQNLKYMKTTSVTKTNTTESEVAITCPTEPT